mgnify:CR=1 FL=1
MAETMASPVALRWAAPAVRLMVRADTHAAATVGLALGVLLGTVPCRVVVTRGRSALWLGPDEWLLLAPPHDHALADTVMTVPASAVDVSHGYLGLEVSGRRAAWCINAFNPLDLDAPAFPVGACTRTVFGKAGIVLWRTETEAFRVEVARSLAPYVVQCLDAARREFLPPDNAC